VTAKGIPKDQRLLHLELERAGYEIVQTGSGHYRVRMGPERRRVLTRSGFDVDSAPAQVILPQTTSDNRRSLRNMRSLLRRIGFPHEC
jgi:hypothetical protein